MEIIEISSAIEQNLSVSYDNRNIVIELKWNDVKGFWYFNLKEDDDYLCYGVQMTLNRNLLYPKFNLGQLYFLDTYFGTLDEKNAITKDDLGNRLVLARVY